MRNSNDVEQTSQAPTVHVPSCFIA